MHEAKRNLTISLVLAVVTSLYLIGGFINIMLGAPVARLAVGGYFVCLFLGLLAAPAAFMWTPRTCRTLSIWSIVPTVPIVGAGAWQAFFPSIVYMQVHFYMDFGGERTFLGVNLSSGLLLILLVVVNKKLTRKIPAAEQETDLPQ